VLKAGQYKCDVSFKLIVVTTCEDEKAPRLYLTQVTVNGETAWQLPAYTWPLKAGSTTEYEERAWLYIHNSAWPGGYPACWVRGWEDPSLWRENPAAEPGKVFMERIEPGMTADDVDLPSDTTPNGWSPPGPYCPDGDCSAVGG
jgi:hypothetical protein